MDAVGNLYRQPGREDRRYSPGGRLREAGGIHYTHDADGNLTEKHTPQGTWRYDWNGAGLLREVQRPDGQRVRMDYDALARRTRKVVLGAEAKDLSAPVREVRFVWDGHVPLHEVASTERVSTWLFEPESFSPLAKEDATGRYAVVTDHLGTPTEMYDELGQLARRMQLDSFGLGKTDVAVQHCPWRWPGQYEDQETGLLYNRFRYYDAYAGRYISQDPLGLEAGPSLYGYPEDPLSATDPLGLRKSCGLRDSRTVRFSQSSVDSKFSDGSKLSELTGRLLTDPSYAAKVEPIRLIRFRDLSAEVRDKLSKQGVSPHSVFTLDNRRLLAARQARTPVNSRWATPSEIAEFATTRRFSTTTGGKTPRVR
ncbi:RHS repeat domain-containing protein [Cystobacter fuscus]